MNALLALAARELTQHCADHPQGDSAAACDVVIVFLTTHGCMRGDLRRFPAFVRRSLARQGVAARVTTAQLLHAAASDRLASALEQAVGSRVELVADTDSALIGGAVLTVGDDRLDGSLRGALKNLEAALKS